MDELVPETQLTPSRLENNSQESIDRVPESPPFYTQEEEEDEEEENEEGTYTKYDVEAPLPPQTEDQPPKVSKITYDDESHPVAGSSKSSKRKSTKSISDVVIDIENEDGGTGTSGPSSTLNDDGELEIEEFPDEDDAILLSAVKDAQEDVAEEGPPEDDVLMEVDDSASLETLALGAELEAQEEEMRKGFDNFRKFKDGDKIFPDVRRTEYNTVAFTIEPPSYQPMAPFPTRFVPRWDSKFVPMPCCDENAQVFKNRRTDDDVSNNETNVNRYESNNSSSENNKSKVRVWQRIAEALSSPMLTSQDIYSAVKRFSRVPSEFKALNYCIDEIMTDDDRSHFFSKVIPFMKKLVLKLPEIVTCPLPILRKNVNHHISLNQRQVACLLANAFFSTFPRRFQFETELPSINFKDLFADNDDKDQDGKRLSMKAQKIRCLIHYFTRVAAQMPIGVVTFTRKNLRHSNMPDWKKIDKGLTNFVPLIRGTIEDDGEGLLKVDFANKIIGGGVLGRGAVQEEILFVIYPELILSRLFTEKLNFCEAVIITGCERFCKYKGYSLNFKFDGDYQDITPYDSRRRRCTQIVAIDALYISRPSFQFSPKHITRELNKEVPFKLVFVTQWYNEKVEIEKRLMLSYYHFDGTIEMKDLDRQQPFLKRIKLENIKVQDLFVGNKLYILGRHMIILDYGDGITREYCTPLCERAFLLVRPEAVGNLPCIIQRLEKCFRIVYAKMARVTKEMAYELSKPDEGEEFHLKSIHSLSGKVVVAFFLMTEKAMEKLRNLIGEDLDPQECLLKNHQCLRALYGHDKMMNGFYYSDTPECVQRDASFFFSACPRCTLPSEMRLNGTTTCCVIKPHILREGRAGIVLGDIVASGFEITGLGVFWANKKQAEEFYEIYNNID